MDFSDLELTCSTVDPELDYFGTQPPTTKPALDRAKREGLDVVYPDDHTLQLDIDSDDDYDTYRSMSKVLSRHISFTSVKEALSRNGNRHITVTTTDGFDVWQRIALQACLGSDRKRELLSFLNAAVSGEAQPILFLEKRVLALPAPAPQKLLNA